MKTIRPVTRYDAHTDYPAVDEGSDRRGFLKAALASAAGLGGALLLAPAAQGGRRGAKYHRRTLYLRGDYRYYPCRLRISSLLVQSKDKRLISYLAKPKHQRAAENALAAVLKKAKCADLTEPKRLKRLHRRLAQALARHYRKKTRRTTRTPIVTAQVRRIRRIPLPGGIRRPPRPVPTP